MAHAAIGLRFIAPIAVSEPQKPTERLIRPVKCHFCNQPMFYTGDERYEPEISVAVNGPDIAEDFYAHVRCWNERMG